tara:strand:- start:1789 stop:1935 length:147 start_codon:yes stop_codon:yes gene_type:complete
MDKTDKLLALLDLKRELNKPKYQRLNLYHLMDLKADVISEIRKLEKDV